MIKEKTLEKQSAIWIPSSDIKIKPEIKFFEILDSFLSKIGFGQFVRELCASYYCPDKGCRPPIDPEVYFKMLMVGFFENLRSERGIASRCADSFSIRHFLHYDINESTPDHSSLSVIRRRLPQSVNYRVFSFILAEMKKQGLVIGKNLAVDSSVMEANASLRNLKNRMTEESYQEYIKKLAAENGVDTNDNAAVARFDRKRKDRKTSNAEWYNPYEPDAKIGKKKDGATDMIYKPENVVDLDTGAIIDANLLDGDTADSTDFSEKIINAQARLNDISDDPTQADLVESATTDKGYYDTDEITELRDNGIVCVIPDRIEHRNLEKLNENQANAVITTREIVKSEDGKDLLKRRGMHVERSFAHILDCGGMRRTTLKRNENIAKRYIIAAACYNLSMIMRLTFGIGTLKQAIASNYSIANICKYMLQSIQKHIEDFIRLFSFTLSKNINF